MDQTFQSFRKDGCRPTLCPQFTSEQTKQSEVKDPGQRRFILRISYQNYTVLTVGSFNQNGLEQENLAKSLETRIYTFNLKSCPDLFPLLPREPTPWDHRLVLGHKTVGEHFRTRRPKKGTPADLTNTTLAESSAS